jgi:hypothetical protein
LNTISGKDFPVSGIPEQALMTAVKGGNSSISLHIFFVHDGTDNMYFRKSGIYCESNSSHKTIILGTSPVMTKIMWRHTFCLTKVQLFKEIKQANKDDSRKQDD